MSDVLRNTRFHFIICKAKGGIDTRIEHSSSTKLLVDMERSEGNVHEVGEPLNFEDAQAGSFPPSACSSRYKTSFRSFKKSEYQIIGDSMMVTIQICACIYR